MDFADSPASLRVGISLLLCQLFLLRVLVGVFFLFFIGWSCVSKELEGGVRGVLRQTKIEREEKGKHRVFLIGEPEGRGMEGRGKRGNSCSC